MPVEVAISPLVPNQFPDFYHTEGPNFVAFVKAYYEWMEEEGQAVRLIRDHLTRIDIDQSIDDFTQYFKSTYLDGLPSSNRVKQAFRIKHIQDLYRSKGTIEGTELFFKLLYGVDASVYAPGRDVFRASSGKWIIPIYLEVEIGPDLDTWVGKQIVGASSSATAIISSASRRNINGKLIDIFVLSNLRGNFEVGEYVSKDGSFSSARKVLGSLTSASITDGGFGISNGDLFAVSSDSGKYAQARVVTTVNGNGQVDFRLSEGGSGYSLSNTVITISNTVLFHGGNTINANNFTVGETIVQNTISFAAANNNIPNSSLVSCYNGANTLLGNAVVYFTNSTFIRISTDTGTLGTSAKIVLTSNALINTAVSNADFSTSNAVVMAVNSIAIGLINVSNTFARGGYMRGLTSNCLAITTRVSSGNGATFTLGSVSNTEVALTQNIGTILTLGSVDPGSNYDTPPMVRINNPAIAAGGKFDWIVGIANVSGTFIVGQTTLAAAGTTGKIRAANTTHLNIIRQLYADNLANNQQIVSFFSNGVISGVAMITSVVNDTNYLMGNNAVVTTNATSFSGVVSEIEIIDSGLGYRDDEELTFTSLSNSEVVFFGSANLQHQGISSGYWEYNNGALNDNKYVHDNYYYQDFSYEVQTELSIEKYVDTLKKFMHIAGTKLFNKVVRNTAETLRLQSMSNIEQS